jgi:hypothetical protein
MRQASLSALAARALPAALLAPLLLSFTGCSWSRFDDVTDSSPIVLLEKPRAMKQGYGVSVATVRRNDDVEVLVGGGVGVSRAALYQLGTGESPSTTTVDSGYCSSAPCFLSSSLAGFANAPGPDRDYPLCFAVGAGTSVTKGLLFRCLDQSEFALAIPKPAQDALDFALDNAQSDDFPLAADRTDHPSLLASSPSARVAWFYPSSSNKFSQLVAPKGVAIDDDSFGKTLTVLSMSDSLGAGRVYAVGVPNKNEVLLWKSQGGRDSAYIGCLGGTAGFGRALASGRVNPDASADLVVSDNVNVHVIDGQALFELPETTGTDCSFGSLPSGALLDSFGCGTNKNLSGCADSEFGAALAVGDLDGDGDGEVIVGAPGMTVRDNSGAGALLVYDAESPHDVQFVDAKFISSAEQGDQLGRALATPSIDGRDIILAGAPGNGKAALFYCSALLPAGAGGSRCP